MFRDLRNFARAARGLRRMSEIFSGKSRHYPKSSHRDIRPDSTWYILIPFLLFSFMQVPHLAERHPQDLLGAGGRRGQLPVRRRERRRRRTLDGLLVARG